MATFWNILLFFCICVGGLENGIAQELTQNLIPCREGWYLFEAKCYKVEGQSKGLTWEKASAQCSEGGGKLATIYSKQQRDFIFSFLLLNSASDAWIGLNDIAKEGQYVWDDGSVFNYTDWEPGEPYGHRLPLEDCVLMRYWTDKRPIGKWNDYECNSQIPYVCQQLKDEKYQNPDPRFCSAAKGGGWKYLNSCYHIVTAKMSWGDAEKYCQDNFKGHLATVLDFRTEHFLNYLLSNYTQPFWYGINIREEARYLWSSGWQVIFNRWKENAPFAEGTCAVRSAESVWDRVSCALSHSFVCETSTDKPPVEENWHCPQSSKDWIKANGKLCYLIETKAQLTWCDANYDCMTKGGSLVNIRSKEELNNLYVQLRSLEIPMKNMNIGLHRKLSNKSEFQWTDGSEVTYQNLLPNDPSSINEECVFLQTHIMRWADHSCTSKLPYICSATKVPPAEHKEKQKQWVCSCSICTQDESSFRVVLNEKDSVPSTANKEKGAACSKTDGPVEASSQTTCASGQDHVTLLKHKNEEHELQIKILNERLNALRLITKFIGENPGAVNLVI